MGPAVTEEGPPPPSTIQGLPDLHSQSGTPQYNQVTCRHVEELRATLAAHHHSQPGRVAQARKKSPRTTLGHQGNLTQGYPGPSRKTQGYKTPSQRRPPKATQGHLRTSQATLPIGP